jgi:hypothetical protein
MSPRKKTANISVAACRSRSLGARSQPDATPHRPHIRQIPPVRATALLRLNRQSTRTRSVGARTTVALLAHAIRTSLCSPTPCWLGSASVPSPSPPLPGATTGGRLPFGLVAGGTSRRLLTMLVLGPAVVFVLLTMGVVRAYAYSGDSKAADATGSGPVRWGFVANVMFAPKSVKCPQVAFAPQSDEVAGQIVAGRVDCRTARAVAAGSAPYPVTKVGARTEFRTHGFLCKGVDAQGRAMARIVFRCRRRYATVAFIRAGTLVERVSPPNMPTKDCRGYNAGAELGDGETTGGAMVSATGIGCGTALALVRPRYPDIASGRGTGGRSEGTIFRLGAFNCQRSTLAAVTLKKCSDGVRGFEFI